MYWLIVHLLDHSGLFNEEPGFKGRNALGHCLQLRQIVGIADFLSSSACGTAQATC